MPETRLERGVFILGVLAIAALGLLVVHLWHNTRDAASTPGTTAPHTLTRPSSATTTPTTTASSTTTERRTTTAATRPSGTGAISLLLKARADTWLEIRSASATGSVLYSGTLSAGSSKAFRAKALWVRFGAAGSLAARLDGKPVRLPSGTYDATFDARGFHQRGG